MSIMDTIEKLDSQSKGPSGKMRDVLAEVVGYNLAQSTMQVKELGTEDVFSVAISKHAYQVDEAKLKEKPKFVGSKIDARMEENINVGDYALLERMLDHGDNSKVKSVNWITSAPMRAGKLMTDKIDSGVIVTVEGFKNGDKFAMTRNFKSEKGEGTIPGKVHVWSPKAAGAADIDAFVKAFDDRIVIAQEQYEERQKAAESGTKLTQKDYPTFTFALRAVDQNANEIKAFTAAISYNETEKRLVSGADLKEAYDACSAKWADLGDNVSTEIMVARTYKSSMIGNLNPTGQLDQMIGATADNKRAMLCSPQSIVVRSTGKFDEKRGQFKGDEREFVNNILCSGRKEHLMEAVKGADDQDLKVAEGLGIEYVQRNKTGKAASAEAGASKSDKDAEASHAEASADGPSTGASSAPDDAQEDDFVNALEAAKQQMSSPGM